MSVKEDSIQIDQTTSTARDAPQLTSSITQDDIDELVDSHVLSQQYIRIVHFV